MPDSLPPELLNRCSAIQDSADQGVPLQWRDYIWFGLATIVLPALLVTIGALL